MSLILWLLFKPVIHLTLKKVEKPYIPVLIDNSASMTVKDEPQSRAEQMIRFLRSEAFRTLEKKATLELFAFSDRLVPFHSEDSLFFQGPVTNLTAVLDELNNDHHMPVRAVLLLSDGGHNAGYSPETRGNGWPFPVFTVGFGSSREMPDVMVTTLLSDNMVYMNEEVPVRAAMRGPGFKDRTVDVVLRAGDREIARRRIKIPENGLETVVHFKWIPESPGPQKLTVAVDGVDGELTENNNRLETYVHVRKHKHRVLIIAGAPGPDLGCLSRLFIQNEHLELNIRTQKPGGQFYEGPVSISEFRDTDLCVLLDMPTEATTPAFWQSFRQNYEQYHWPLLIVAGSRFEERDLGDFDRAYPVRTLGRLNPAWVRPVLTEQGIQHPVPMINQDISRSRACWDQLPPVVSFRPRPAVLPDAKILLSGQAASAREEQRPLIIARSISGIKNILLTFNSIYRWQLLMWQNADSQSFLFRFLENCVRWLTAEDDGRPVRLITEDQVMKTGMPVIIKAEVYDESLQPVEGASVKIQTIGSNDTLYTLMQGQGNGRYRADLDALVSGDYRVVAEAVQHNHVLGRDTTRFSVSAFQPEFLDTRAHPDILSAISRVTGGIFVSPDSADLILSKIRLSPEMIVNQHEIRPYRHPAVLFVVLLLLSAEWWMRRRKGMM